MVSVSIEAPVALMCYVIAESKASERTEFWLCKEVKEVRQGVETSVESILASS